MAFMAGLVMFFALPIADRFVIVTAQKKREIRVSRLGPAMRELLVDFKKRTGRSPTSLLDPEFAALARELVSQQSRLEARSGDNGLPLIDLRHFGHPPSSEVENYSFIGRGGKIDEKRLKDTGRWLYDAKSFELIIDCTHPATKSWFQGPVWTWQSH